MKRRLLVGGIAIPVALVVAVVSLRPRLEAAIGQRLAAEAAARGLEVEFAAVRVGFWPPLLVQSVTLRKAGVFEARVPEARVFLHPRGSGLVGRLSVAVPAGMEVRGSHGLALRIGPSSWRVARHGNGISLRRTGIGAGFVLHRTGQALRIEATNEVVGSWLELLRERRPVFDPGTLAGYLEVRQENGRAFLDLDLEAQEVRLVSLESLDGSGAAHSWGGRFSAHARFVGVWDPESGSVSVTAARLVSDLAVADATLSVTGMGTGKAQVRLSSAVQGLAFDRLFGIMGVVLPVSTHGLGRAEIGLTLEGREDVPEAARIDPRFVFTPPDRLPEALLALREPFRHGANGSEPEVLVSPASPDFVSYSDLPPLFLRTLLLGEDAGFFGHPGVDLGEIPKALAADWARGGVSRGASTITQQLAKNLFLSREKRVSRKLKELGLALLLESSLSKERILEIYLNIIEWGPGVYGLRPASRHYFGKEPGELTAREGAFLVAIIPGPIKYQRSIAQGETSERFRPLVENLLGKLLAVGALDEREHEAAMASRLEFRHLPAPPDAAPPASDDELAFPSE